MTRTYAAPRKLSKEETIELSTEVETGRASDPFSVLIGADPDFRRLLETAREIARTRVGLLIRGETGTGKSLLVGAIHVASRRVGPLSIVRCATLSDLDLMPSAGATVVLDEVGDLSRVDQDRLCQVMDSPACPDVRWIALTHRDLEERVRRENFLAELYYRLRVVTLDLPPLRRRRTDIEPLLRCFVAELCTRYRRTPPRFSESAKKALRRYAWPGNVRELRNFCEQVVLTRSQRDLGAEDLPLALRFPGRPRRDTVELPPSGLRLDDWVADLLRQALVRSGGNRSRAARLLGITRDTFNYRVKKYGIRV